MFIQRLPANPIIHPGLSQSLGGNINGPSLLRAPPWVDAPLGRYYLYFAHHKGSFIRLAHADSLAGRWTVHEPGTLQLEDSLFTTERLSAEVLASLPERKTAESQEERVAPHIASPEVHLDVERRQVRMYFHGLLSDGTQRTRVALSDDGLTFRVGEEILALPYLRVFQHHGAHYGIAMPGQLYRSADGLTGFAEGPRLFGPDMRHCGLQKRGDTLRVFWTQVGDAPERILRSDIDLSGDWLSWRAQAPVDVLRPDEVWEGAGNPVEPSLRGAINGPVAQLRDPYVYEEDGESYLLYATAGESGIAIAQMRE